MRFQRQKRPVFGRFQRVKSGGEAPYEKNLKFFARRPPNGEK